MGEEDLLETDFRWDFETVAAGADGAELKASSCVAANTDVLGPLEVSSELTISWTAPCASLNKVLVDATERRMGLEGEIEVKLAKADVVRSLASAAIDLVERRAPLLPSGAVEEEDEDCARGPEDERVVASRRELLCETSGTLVEEEEEEEAVVVVEGPLETNES